MSSFSLENIEIDYINYDGPKDFQIVAEYINETTANIIIKRLDTMNPNKGWTENLQIFANDNKGNIFKITTYPSPSASTLAIPQIFPKEFQPLKPSTTLISNILYSNYQPFPKHYPMNINLQEFNNLFDTDIVTLPSSIFAIGIKNGGIYRHHNSYGQYPWTYEIELSIDHILGVIMSQNKIPNLYFLICAHDGYMEGYYPSPRLIPHKHDNSDEYKNKVVVYTPDPNTFPYLHKHYLVLGQSVHPDTKNVIAIPDRYYFCLNRYNLYHSIHKGILFKNKISKIVYACNPRGNKYNFTKRKDIEIGQREYFKSNAVPKDNIHSPENIERDEMIHYKYILDIDGNASTWDATAWKLNSGSVILKTDSNWIQWFYDDYKAWIHYVPIKDDFTDIQEKFKWCEENQEKCEIIIYNAKQLFQKIYRHHNVVKYTVALLEKTLLEKACKTNAFYRAK